jgi:hypothetical protein
VLPLPELQSALARCDDEVYWRPAHKQGILAVPLWDEGVSGGVEVPSYKQRRRYQALVVAVNETKVVQVGDLINFDMGRADEVYTYRGELFVHIAERNASAVDEEFGKEPEPEKPKETQLPSGLWIAG